MIYYMYRAEEELPQCGIQEGELAIYTGTLNPRQPKALSHDADTQNAFVFLWRDGRPQKLNGDFQHDRADIDVLEVRTEAGEYTFLRDEPSGYVRQISGPAEPIVVANLGAIPLRVDTFLGKFTVHAGTMLRLDESAPQREKKEVLLTVGARRNWPLESAELWDGLSWRRLNICEQYSSIGRELAVLDGSAVVQYITVQYYEDSDRYWLVMKDSPEPDPDYEIYITGIGLTYRDAQLRFNRSEYRNGQAVQRVWKISFLRWGEPVIYDLQKLRESLTQSAADQCTAELPGREAVSALEEWQDSLHSDKLRETHEPPTPEPPGDFPE